MTTALPKFIDNMSFIQLNLFIFSLFIVFIALGLYVSEKVWPSEKRIFYNNTILGIMQVVGVVFAIIVGTIIVSVWTNFDNTRKITIAEAGTVGDLYRSVKNLKGLEPLRPLLLDYGHHVIETEWPMMRKGEKPTSGWKYLFRMQNILNQQKEPRDHVQSSLTNLFDNRRLRIASTDPYLPSVIYFLLFFLSVFILFFSFLVGTKNMYSHAFICACLALPLCLTITTVAAMDYPYSTQIFIEPNDMKTVLYNLTHLSDT
jgi:hypothetical protein